MSCTSSILLILLGIVVLYTNKDKSNKKLCTVGCILIIFGLFLFLRNYVDLHKIFISCTSIANNINNQIESYDKDMISPNSCYNIDDFENRINNIFHMINYLQFTINSNNRKLSSSQLEILNHLVKVLQNKFVRSEVLSSKGKQITKINGKPSCNDFCTAEEDKSIYDGKSCTCPPGYESKIMPSGFVSCVFPSSTSTINKQYTSNPISSNIEQLQSDIKQGVNNILSSYSNINCNNNVCTFSNAPLKFENLDKTIPLSSKIQGANSLPNNILSITHKSYGKPQPRAIRKDDPYMKIYKKQIPLETLNIALGNNASVQEKVNYIYNKVLNGDKQSFGLSKIGDNLVVYFGDVDKSVNVSPSIFNNLDSENDIAFYDIGKYPVYEQSTEYFALYKLF